MKKMRHFSTSIVLIGNILISTSCSHKQLQEQNNIALKMDQLELRMQKIESSMRDVLLKESTSNFAGKLQLREDSIKKEYEKLKLQLKGPWYRGRDFPYEPILDGLTKQGYDLSYYDNFVPASTASYKRVLLIKENTSWNMEDANKIKGIVMKTLTFEPEVDKYSTMTWTASKYDIEVYSSGSGKIIIRFLSK